MPGIVLTQKLLPLHMILLFKVFYAYKEKIRIDALRLQDCSMSGCVIDMAHRFPASPSAAGLPRCLL